MNPTSSSGGSAVDWPNDSYYYTLPPVTRAFVTRWWCEVSAPRPSIELSCDDHSICVSNRRDIDTL